LPGLARHGIRNEAGEMPPAAEMPSLLDDGAFLEELEKLETGTPRPQPVSRPAFWGGATNAPAPQRSTAPPPAAHASVVPAPAADHHPVEPVGDSFVWPEPALEKATADHVYYRDGELVTHPHVTPSQKMAALVVILGIIAGAGSAAWLFEDRVEQIVTAWTVVSR
jgi:hypothetical protein